MKFPRGFAALPLLLGSVCHAGVSDSKVTADRWISAKFSGVEAPIPPSNPYLIVQPKASLLARNQIQGRPLLIAEQKYGHGIGMRAPGKITVRLPRPAKLFEAVVGVDSNDVGYYSNSGRGSVEAVVSVNGKEIYRSPTLHEGMKGIPISIDLDDAREFTLQLIAVGLRSQIYRPEWDQADWAKAEVVFDNQDHLSLANLPIGPLDQPFVVAPPFSFRYGGHPSSEFLKNWHVERSTRQLDDERTEHTSTYEDPETHLIARCVAVVYRNFPTVEWTVYFKNAGTAQTPILEDIEALDTEFQGGAEDPVILHHSRGSSASVNDFQPLETSFPDGNQERFSSIGGRPTDGDMPYFNLAWPGHGAIFALGWPGQWSLTVSREKPSSIRTAGGQELTRFWLAPEEEVRTPLAVVQFWNGDWIDGQNVWRRWMAACNLPRPGGALPASLLASGSNRFTVEMQGATEENQKTYIDRILQEGIPIDHWWMDAGWYPFKAGWWQTGTWEPDPARFPDGLRPITQYAHAQNLKAILWFEPERVSAGSWLSKNHPEWLLGAPDKDRLLFLGNPEARQWLINHVSKLISEQGVDVYRQDFNFPPLALWRDHDGKDREGITEIEHVEGYLAYFDELRRRFPSMLIDTCASGGRRLDLETLRRAVPLWRSDYPGDPIAQQAQTYGLSLWIPYFGTSVTSSDPYLFRSQMTPSIGLGFDPAKTKRGVGQLLRMLRQWREVIPYFYGDFIPLTSYNIEKASWIAWQFNGPEQGSGVIEAFRREDSPFSAARFPLHGLDPHATYKTKELDGNRVSYFTGAELMRRGFSVSIPANPGAMVILYRKVGESPPASPVQ